MRGPERQAGPWERAAVALEAKERSAAPVLPPAARPGLLTRDDAAAFLRVSVRTFERHVQPGLPSVRLGRRVLFRPGDLDAWLVANTTPGSISSSAPATVSLTGDVVFMPAAPGPRSVSPEARAILERLRKPRKKGPR